MSSDEISLNGLNSQLVYQEQPLRPFSCHQQQKHHHHHHQHHHNRVSVGGVASGGGGGDPGPKTRELTGFIDEKMFTSVDRERFFRQQQSIFGDHREHPQPQQESRDWTNNLNGAAVVTSPSTDESGGDDDDDVDDEDEDEEEELEGGTNNDDNKNSCNTYNLNCISNSNNDTSANNISIAIPVGDKLGNGKAKQISTGFGE